MKHFKLLFLTLLLPLYIGNVNTTFANVKPAKIFSSNMVLQKGINNTIWGWADKNESISISLNGKTVKTKAGKNGKWTVKLPAMEYGGPYTLSIKGKNLIELTNVMVGEVWVCSGQSNMQWNVAGSNNSTEEIQSADYPDIRIFQVPRKVAQTPQDDIEAGSWEICSPNSIDDFSAVAYFFARELHKKLNVPVGVIESAYGGTVAETWISQQTIQNDPDFVDKLIELRNSNIKNEQEQNQKQIRDLFGDNIPKEDIGMVNGKPVWATVNIDESHWRTIKVPQSWEEQGYTCFDGVAYYRYEINLTDGQSKNNAILHLGKVDDSDIAWMNGIEIGKTERTSSADRIYPVDGGYLKSGKNVLLVRVEDVGGKGGIRGEPENLFLLVGNEKVNLSGEWKFRFAKPVIITDFMPNKYPTLLFNSMINPIIPYGIKGVIWYQGESNASRAFQYQHLFPSLITDWRKHWQLDDFPFIWVQLANYMKPVDQPTESDWAELREAQTMTLKLSNTGMASAIDIGDAKDIHPRNKQEVGRRLALNALKISYGKEIIAMGPTYKSMKVEGNKVVITFSSVGTGFKIKSKYGYINGFTVAGVDKKFYWAKAILLDDNSIAIYSEEVQSPVAVRYGWADNPDDLNLYNSEDLPANPFRTDDWQRSIK